MRFAIEGLSCLDKIAKRPFFDRINRDPVSCLRGFLKRDRGNQNEQKKTAYSTPVSFERKKGKRKGNGKPERSGKRKRKTEEKSQAKKKAGVLWPEEAPYLGEGGLTASSVRAPVISREPLLPVISQKNHWTITKKRFLKLTR